MRRSRTLVATAAAALLLSACSRQPAAEPLLNTDPTPSTLEKISLPLPFFSYGEDTVGRLAVDAELLDTADASAPLSALVYRLQVPQDLDRRADQLAALLDLSGARQELSDVVSPAPGGSRYVASAPDGSSRELTVSADGSWYFSASLTQASYDCTDETGLPEAELSAGECALAALSVDETQQLATQWLERLGLTGAVGPLLVSATSGSYAEAALLVDGQESGLWVGFGFDANGQLAYAYGQLAVPQPVERYPLLSPAETAERLARSLSAWYTPPGGVLRPLAATPLLVATADVQGVWWLLPGYRFDLGDDTQFVEQALMNEHLEYVQLPSLGDSPVSDADLERLAAAVAAELIGLGEAEATERLLAAGLPWRLARRDEETFLGTMDYVAHRVSLEVERGVVRAATLG